jgi:hypothetical protein
MRKDIFEQATNTLFAPVLAADTEIQVSFDTAGFELTPHGTGYTDAPSATVGYIRIENETIRYTAKTGTSAPWKFTGCTRGALNTRAADHPVDTTQSAERRLKVTEYVLLEGPAISVMYQILTGKDRFGAAALPTKWHLGIPLAYVRLADFTGVGSDMWDLSDELQGGFPVRFEDMEKTDGKKFIEQQLALLAGVFMPVHADGSLGCKRMAAILSGASAVAMLDESNSISTDPLVQDFSSLHNIIRIRWSWEPLQKAYARGNVYIDGPSITMHKKGSPLNLEFRGLHGSRHSEASLRNRFDSIRDRYSGPPLRTGSAILGRFNGLEVGDVVRERMDSIRDINENGTLGRTLDRAFEIQNIAIDWVKQRVKVALFGSSRAPTPIHAGDSGVIPQSYYVSEGTELSTVPGIVITGSNPGRVTTGATITGAATMAGAIYYYNGDLQIESPLIFTGNAFLKVYGHLQNNAANDGKARGLAAGAVGTAGFVGTTESGGGLEVMPPVFGTVISTRGVAVIAPNSSVPSFNLSWDGSALLGLPADLRGSSGSTGAIVHGRSGFSTPTTAAGGAGGAGGAGLMVLCKGFSQGASGSIDLSGGDGANGESLVDVGNTYYAGSGAGGAPGGLLIVLDGAGTSATELGEANIRQFNGKTPIRPGQRAAPVDGKASENYSYFVGTGDGTTFDLPNLSGDSRGGTRTQYVLNTGAPVADLPLATLPQPSSLSLASGTDELLGPMLDGTIVSRVKMTWSPVADARVAGYDVQFKRSIDTIWQFAPSVIGQSQTTTWVTGVTDGVNMDFRVRAAGSLREVSEWTEFTDYPVLGKSEKPASVGALSFTDPILSWPPNTEDDLGGYIVRYQPSGSNDWDTAAPAHEQGFITSTKFDVSAIVGGSTRLLVKAVDTTRNESASATTVVSDLRPATPSTFLISVQPDGTREFSWATTTPPSDLDGLHLRYFLGTTSDWDAMTPLQTGILKASPFETNQLAAGTYTFAAKNVDKAGNESASAIFITTVTIADPRIAGSIEDIKDEPNWTETKTNAILDGATGWLVASGSGTWADIPTTWDAWNSWIVTPSGSIQYERLIDIGVITTFTPLVTVLADSAGGSVTIEEAHSDTGTGGSYSAFAAVGPQLTTRFIKIRVTVTGSFPKINAMRTILSAATLTEIIEDLDTSTLTGSFDLGVGNVRLPITKPFNVIKKVDVTLQSVGAGWSWELIDKDTSVGPQIKIYNSSNALADATIDATVIGV